MTVSIQGLREIEGEFDAFIIDQFGVIHDGKKLYPDASAAMAGLKAAGKKVAILTNSGKRRAANHARILAMGIPGVQFTGVVSSGDVAYAAISSGKFGHFGSAMIVGRDGEDYAFDGLGMTFTTDPGVAALLIVLGSNAPKTSLADYRRQLAPAARRAIPAICCNPDLEMLTSQGLQPAPGAIAKLYEDLGGIVTWVGKPYVEIYQHALDLVGNPDPARTLAIGDSLLHDVKGGVGAGLKTALVRTGIATGLSDEAILNARPAPDYLLPSLCW